MKFEIAKSELLPRLAVLAKVADGKVVPILADILITVHSGILSMTAGNGVTSINCEVDDVKVIKTGTATIPASKLHSVVSKMGETIVIEAIGMKVRVTSGKSKYEFAGQDPLMYQQQTSVIGEMVTISGSDFKQMVTKTSYAASTNENQKILQGIRFVVRASILTATACDRHRLAEVSKVLKKGFTDSTSVVNGQLFKDFISVIPDGDISLTFSENNFQIKTAEYNIVMRVFEGTYPDTSKLINGDFTTFIDVNLKDFKLALERALIIALDDKTNVLKMDIGTEGFQITASSETDKAYEEVEAKVSGSPLKVSFNGKYMIQALSTIDVERVKLNLNTHMTPIIIDTSQSKDFQLILPYRTTT